MKKKLWGICGFMFVWAAFFALLGVWTLLVNFVNWNWEIPTFFAVRLWAVATLGFTAFLFSADTWADYCEGKGINN